MEHYLIITTRLDFLPLTILGECIWKEYNNVNKFSVHFLGKKLGHTYTKHFKVDSSDCNLKLSSVWQLRDITPGVPLRDRCVTGMESQDIGTN